MNNRNIQRKRFSILGILGALFGLSTPAHADGWYRVDSVAQKSVLFASAAEVSNKELPPRQARLEKAGRGLMLLDLSMGVLGERADAELRSWALATRKTVTGESLRLQRHIDLLQNDYGTQFMAALERAIVAEKGKIVECASSNGLPGMAKKANCPGEDLSANLAARMDKDPQLKAAVAEINALPWPDLSDVKRPATVIPLTGSKSWMNLGAIVEAVLAERIEARQAILEKGLEPLEEAIAKGDAAALEAARGLRANYEAGLAADGKVLLEGLTAWAQKDGPPQVGLCPVPPSLGGCGGEDVTKANLDALAAHKRMEKVRAALPPLP